MKNYKIIVGVLFAICMSTTVSSQDAHFSQFDANPMMNNPALTGMFDHSDFRVGTSFRSQWGSVTNSFLTTGFSIEMMSKDKFGYGAYMQNYDMAGAMKTFDFGGAGSYNITDNRSNYQLTVGVQFGLRYKKVNDRDLLFDNQYNDGFFDSDLASGENFEKLGRIMPDGGLGIAYRVIKSTKRFKPFANFSAYHVNLPDESVFRVEKSVLPIRWSGNLGGDFEIHQELWFRLAGMYQRQGQNQEIVALGMVDWEISNTAYNLIGGLGYRMQDAVIAHLGVKHRNNTYRISYDVNTSPLSEFTNKRGALEFSIIYCGSHSGRASARKNQSTRF